MRERRQDLLKLVIADGQERNGNEGNASGWDDPSPSKNGKSGDGGQDRGTGRWANLSDDDSDGAGSDFEGVGTKEGRSKGVQRLSAIRFSCNLDFMIFFLL